MKYMTSSHKQAGMFYNFYGKDNKYLQLQISQVDRTPCYILYRRTRTWG